MTSEALKPIRANHQLQQQQQQKFLKPNEQQRMESSNQVEVSGALLNGRAAPGGHINQLRHKFNSKKQQPPAPRRAADSNKTAEPAEEPMQEQENSPADEANAVERQVGSSSEALDDKQHHGGPVMGIFFKVWSLVKVTRGRHQKMRRQNSEDAGQFHFISGEQLASTSGQRHGLAAAAQHRLQDSHFRRAGSQPAPSTGHNAAVDHLLPRSQQQNWLQVRAQQQQQPQGNQVAPTGTASGSSSGVSSITSSTLAATGSETTNTGSRLGSPTAVESKRKLASISLRPQQQQEQRGTWASRIKRSATTLNQSDSSKSRPLKQAPAPLEAPAERQARAKSEQTNQPDELHRRWMRAHLIARETISDDENNDAGPDAQSGANKHSLLVGDEDSDFNDIYSTPNDSIQSVPSSAPPIAPLQNISQSSRVNSRTSFSQNQNGFSYPIKKSLSANNFSQLVQANRQTQEGANNCGPIEEQQEGAQVAAPLKSSFQQPDSNSTDNSRLKPDEKGKRLVVGSRFFISSSSSEESNPPGQQQQSIVAKSTMAADNSSTQVHQQRAQVHFGLHHHEPHMMATRPGSLILNNGRATAANVQFAGPQLFSPTSNGTLCATTLAGTPLVAAMSPAAPVPLSVNAHYWVPASVVQQTGGYKKSPSLFEMSHNSRTTRFSSRFPSHNTQLIDSTTHNRLQLIDQKLSQQQAYFLSSFKPSTNQQASSKLLATQVPNSVSLQDCKLSTAAATQANFALTSKRAAVQKQQSDEMNSSMEQLEDRASSLSEYKLTRMLLESGSNPAAKDQGGYTALMHAVLSENLPALKCLIEHQVDLNVVNNQELSALDLVCSRTPSEIRVEMLKLLIDNQADLDRTRESDGTRLLDRLIAEHQAGSAMTDKLPFIDCLLHNGAKLGSSTWQAANGKHEVQLRLLKKLCQDGYFLYKKCSIEPAVYRFEYALKRIAELEKQLDDIQRCQHPQLSHIDETIKATQLIKYQTYLGLSRCERKRKFFKRALEFAHMSILVNSTSYEGYYSKANILKDLGEFNEALLAINQTNRLVENIIEMIKGQLSDLQHQEESIVFDGCFDMHDPGRSCLIEASRNELIDNLEYLEEAKIHIARLKSEILEDKESAVLGT